ncbi:MAG: polysaccharide biosynthesis tyrosine autokinase [Desulfuromonadales bacterium]|nr:polysaccharide biosynthesis tyrosine autokinase [Desulfuromonadales bacterium]
MNDQSPQSQQNNPQFEMAEEVHLQDYLSVLFRRRRAVVTTFLLLVALVGLYTLLMKPVYELTTTLHVRDDKVRGGNGMLEGLGLTQQNPVETEIEILKSRTNAEEVVRRLKLDWLIEKKSEGLQFDLLEFSSTEETPEYKIVVTGPQVYQVFDHQKKLVGEGVSGVRLQTQGLTLVLDRLNGPSGSSFELSQLSFPQVVQDIRKSIRASEVGKGTNIIRVAYEDVDPLRGRDLVNTMATVYLERAISLKTEEARKSVEFIDQQLEEVRTFLDSAEQSLETFKRDSGIVRLDTEAEALIDQLTAAEKERSAVSLRKRQVEFALETLEKAIAQGQGYAPSVLLDDPVVAGLSQSMAELEIEKQALTLEVTEAHPAALSLKEQIQQTQRKLRAIYKSSRMSLSLRHETLTSDMNRYEEGLKKLPAAEQQLARLTRLATVNADIYTFLLQKHEEARIARAATISNISVIDPAIVPDRPVKPNKKKNLLLGLIVGLMLGVGLAFFQEYLDDSIKDAETAKRILGIPVLSVIPHIRPEATQKDADGQLVQRTLVTYKDPRSPAAEAFRSLRTSLHFSCVNREDKVVLVTSTFPGEGKTTVSANFAETLAQTGARVLLVGCDLRRPTLHTIFDKPKTPGLTELLVGDVTAEEVIHQTGIHRLDFISAGTTPPNPAELIGGKSMRELLQELRKDYDTIVLDAPPMLAVTDSSLLTTLCDVVMVVLEAGGVRIKAAQRLREMLEAAHAPTAGFVLNDKDGKGYEYYSSYGGQYGYGYYGPAEEDSQRQRSLLRRIFRG